MHILHISSDFSNTSVHANLYKELDKLGVEQTVFNPIRVQSQNSIGRNEFEADHTRFVYAPVVKPYHRYVYHIKRLTIFHELQKKVDLKKVDLVHASTLFTDGGQAYKIFRKYHIPYVVAVRTTDISGFLDNLPNTYPAARKILRNAEMLFFISKALMDKFANHKVIKPLLPEIKDKMLLVPNGIDEYFLNHISNEPISGHKVLYLGNFSANKNVKRLGEAILRLREDNALSDVSLTLVGGGQDAGDEVKKMIESNHDVFNFVGPIYDKERICEVFRSHSVFAMPSITETFGLVYLEALSQNLPVVYTKGQGIDGLFDESVGVGVNPLSVDDIAKAVKTIIENREHYSNTTIDFEKFRWKHVAEVYLSFYNELMKNDKNTMNLLKLIKKLGGGSFQAPSLQA